MFTGGRGAREPIQHLPARGLAFPRACSVTVSLPSLFVRGILIRGCICKVAATGYYAIYFRVQYRRLYKTFQRKENDKNYCTNITIER